MEEHDIHSFLRNAQRDMENEYKRILKRASEAPGTAATKGKKTGRLYLKIGCLLIFIL
jgi:hypothetical protein